MATLVLGDFEWDTAKDAANRRKHGVSFVEAMSAFLDPRGITAPDLEHEDRFVLIGRSSELRVLFVVSAETADDRVRIISARKASRAQRKVYQHGSK